MVVGVLVGGCVGGGVALGNGAVGVAVIGAEQPMQPTISNPAARVKSSQDGNGLVTVTYLSRRSPLAVSDGCALCLFPLWVSIFVLEI
jgi:hypothetical protein